MQMLQVGTLKRIRTMNKRFKPDETSHDLPDGKCMELALYDPSTRPNTNSARRS